jgi:two-component system, response regulator, stage 0 sporulation protein F
MNTIPGILVVDDERDVELLFMQRFRKEIRDGIMRLRFAFSGEEAEEMLRQPDAADLFLILSDINMPGMTGIELLRRIKARTPALKVFMVTAYGDEHTIKQAQDSGADRFINKPVDFTDLKIEIFRVLQIAL